MARCCQGWVPKPNSQAGQIRVTPLVQKGSPAKSGVSRAALRGTSELRTSLLSGSAFVLEIGKRKGLITLQSSGSMGLETRARGSSKGPGGGGLL